MAVLAELKPLGPEDQFADIDNNLLPLRGVRICEPTPYMLDTNIVSDLVRNPQGAVMRHIVKVGPEAVCVSIITAAELRYGCARRFGQAARECRHPWQHTDPGLRCSGRCRVRRHPRQAGGCRKAIGPNDLLIAVHAYALSAVLVTANTTRVPVHGLLRSRTDRALRKKGN